MKRMTFALVFANRGFMPGELIYDARTRRLLGANVAGPHDAVMRTDVFAVAIHAGMTTEELGMTDLAYAPPFASVWDAVHIAANAAK